MQNLTVYKDNDVINASYKLTLNEQRLILSCIGKIKSNEIVPCSMSFFLSAKEYAELFNISKQRAYYDLKEIAERLYERSVIIDAKSLPDEFKTDIPILNGKFKTRWISHIHYDPDEKGLAVGFSPVMIPYLSQLKKEFTKYSLSHVSKMTSVYAIRLYELLAQHQFKEHKEVYLSTSEIREKMQLGEKYDVFGNLNSRVIQPAIAQINEHSNFNVEFSFKKDRKKIVGIKFNFVFKSGLEATRNAKNNPNSHATHNEVKENARPGETEVEARSRIIMDKKNARHSTNVNKDLTVNGITFQDETSMNDYIENKNISRDKEVGLKHLSKLKLEVLNK
jgi:plasmid replication initiation protein